MRIRYTPSPALDTGLLSETIHYLLHGFQPEPGQTEVTNEQLLTLARSLEPEHLALIRDSRVWIDLKTPTSG